MQRVLREEGFYAMRILDHTVGWSSNGNPMLTLVMEVVGRYEDALAPLENFKTFPAFAKRMYLTVTEDHEEDGHFIPGTVTRVMEDLRHLGFEGAWKDLRKYEFDRSRIHMTECRHKDFKNREGVWRLDESWSVFRKVNRGDARADEVYLELARLFDGGEVPPVRKRQVRQSRVTNNHVNGVHEEVA